MTTLPTDILSTHPDAVEVILPGPGFVSIYVLLDPRTDKVRYVGRAINPAMRLSSHLSFPKWDDTMPKQKWLRELVILGLRPRMFVFETVAERQSINRERHWILFYRAKGEADCNCHATASEEKYQKSKKNNLAAKRKWEEAISQQQDALKR